MTAPWRQSQDAPGVVPPSTALADVLALHGLSGWLSPPLRGLHTARQPVVGSALTVQLEPSGGSAPPFDELYDLLSCDISGRVIVIAGAAECHGAVWGQILSRAAWRSGARAVLIDGRVRDVGDLAREGLPVWATAQATVGPAGALRVSAVGCVVQIDSVTVASGSVVVHDADGVVVVPGGGTLAAELLRIASEYSAAEAQVLADLADGVPLKVAYRHKRVAVTRLRAAILNAEKGGEGLVKDVPTGQAGRQ